MKKVTRALAAIMLMTAVFYPAECLNAQTYKGHDYVDLGLPSGTLWATCNVGATTPEDYGDYFAWGETQPKKTYNWSTYKYGGKDKLTKYCNKSNEGNNGFTDNLTVLQPGDDAATANWGSGWRMPTEAQWRELKDYTTSTWATRNGVSGRLFTADNGNSLFLPGAGGLTEDLHLHRHEGLYWSSSLGTDDPWFFYFSEGNTFNSGKANMDSFGRIFGRSVRAVRSEK